jgi:propanediol utilization protein
MEAAVVTLKLTPTEFDLVRKALDSLVSEDYEITKKSELPAPVRAAAREEHVVAGELRSKLR